MPADGRRSRPASRWSYRLGRVAGIEVRVHASFLVLVALVGLAALSPSGPAVVATVGWLAAVFGCVLLHELAHSLVARTRGIGVRDIELLPIGGVSQLERLPDNPRDEFAIAIVGPLTSIGLAIVAAGVATVLHIGVWPPDLIGGGFVARFLWFNLLVGFFNLLPAFPLDGGRVLRALLERHMDLGRATRISARLGRWLAIVMILIGLYSNIWLVVIGVFVFLGSAAEEAATVLHERLKAVRVADVMVGEPLVLQATMPAAQAKRLLRHTAQREFPVVRADDCYIGMVEAAAIEQASDEVTVGYLAVPVTPVGPDDPVEATELLESGEAAVPVVGVAHVIGIVRADDVRRVATQVRPSDR